MTQIPCPIQRRALSRNKHHPAVILDYEEISYAQLNQLIEAAVAVLHKEGVRARLRVGVLPCSSLEFIVLYFALLRMKVTAGLLSPRLPSESVRKMCRQMECKFLISNPTDQHRIRGVRVSKVDQLFEKIRAYQPTRKKVRPATLDIGQTSNIMLTSGSTGKPKAAVHSVGNHHYSALGSNKHIRVNRADRWILSLPTYHVSGLSILWRMFTAGAIVVIPGRKTQLGDALIQHQITHMSVVPTQVQVLMSNAKHRRYLKQMKAILVGGSMVGEQLKLDMLKHGLPFHLTYGLTEMSSQVATTRRIETYQDFNKAEVLEYCKIWIDPKFNVWVAGETLFKGYLVDGRVRSRLNKDGFFRTGDIGRSYLIKYLRVSGRADNMFISGGENVYPEQIEQALMRINGVLQAIVVPVPNEHYGQRPVAVVKFRDNKRLSAQKLSKFLALNIEKYKVPDQYVIWPKSESKNRLKISRSELLDYVLTHQNPRNIIR